jgi:DhnA family fructose-bisphosphate aldolase class Ia
LQFGVESSRPNKPRHTTHTHTKHTVAIDHGVFNEDRFLDGIEDMGEVLQKVVAAQPDAVQVTIGQARSLHNGSTSVPQGGRMPALVIRTDVANIYGNKKPQIPFCDLQHPDIVLQALQMDACGVICNLFMLPDDAEGAGELHRKCIQNVTHLRSECSKYGMVLLVEPLVYYITYIIDITYIVKHTTPRRHHLLYSPFL